MSDNIFACPYHSQKQNITGFDMIDPIARANPYPYYEWLQQDELNRIYKLPQEKAFYVVHQFEDVKKVLANNSDFINHILPTKKGLFFALMDGKEHLRIRTIVAKMLSFKNPDFPLDEMNKHIERCGNAIIQHKRVELFDAWALPIPIGTLCILLGLNSDKETIDKLHEQAVAVNRALFVLGGTGPRRKNTPTISEKMKISWALLKNSGRIRGLYKIIGKQGMKELGEMLVPKKTNLDVPRPQFDHLAAAISPLFDMMLLFAKAIENNNHPNINSLKEAIAKKELTLVEAIMVCTFIVFAGYEPTSSILSNCVAHLAQNPTTFNHLKEHPASIENFIEEALRVYTPVGRFIRRANKDVVIGKQTIPKDAMVIVMIGAANIDAKKYDNPAVLNPTRENANTHLSFGKGIHYCLGAHLARYQTKVALEHLIKNTTKITLDKSFPLEVLTDRDNGILRYEKLHIILET